MFETTTVRARLALAEQVASSLVLLFRAPGGGWSPRTETTLAQAGTR